MIAVAVTRAELDAFFPGSLQEELLEIASPQAFFDPALTPEKWNVFLSEHQPEVVVTHWATPPFPADAISHLRYVAHVTGSVRKLVPRYFLERGLRVTNWGDAAGEVVAEGTLMLILASLRETQYWGREMHERGAWRNGFGQGKSLFESRVGIHGFGRIARALIALLAPFRAHVAVFSDGVPPELIRSHGAEPLDSLDRLFDSQPDIVVELEALTPKTVGSVKESHLRALRPDSLFVNSGRGAVVDEAALARIAGENRLRLALDVFAVEPLPGDSPLRGPSSVTLMPHVSGPTPDRFPVCGRQVLFNLRRWLEGGSLENEVDLSAYDIST